MLEPALFWQFTWVPVCLVLCGSGKELAYACQWTHYCPDCLVLGSVVLVSCATLATQHPFVLSAASGLVLSRLILSCRVLSCLVSSLLVCVCVCDTSVWSWAAPVLFLVPHLLADHHFGVPLSLFCLFFSYLVLSSLLAQHTNAPRKLAR